MKYYMWVFFAIGLPANILTIISILKFYFVGPASFLLCYLAAIDNVAIVAKLIEANLMYTNLINKWSSFLCKTIELPGALFTAISNWTLILICTERYVSVCKPLKRKIWISNKRCKGAVSLVFIFLTILYTTLFLIFVDVSLYNTCHVIYFEQHFFRLIQFIIGFAIPFVFITTLTISVIRALYIARGQRRQMHPNVEEGRYLNINDQNKQNFVSNSKNMEQTLSRLMVSSAILYFIITGPYSIFALGYLPFYEWRNSQSHAVTIIISDIFFILMDASHLLNVFVYLIFVPGFRDNVYKLLKTIF